LQSISKVLAN